MPSTNTTPVPPYYAVIFTSIKNTADEGYAEMAEEMTLLAQQQPGYIGHESARNELGITVSYWKDLVSIRNWKQNARHLLAQGMGREKWYYSYRVRICLVEREYDFNSGTE